MNFVWPGAQVGILIVIPPTRPRHQEPNFLVAFACFILFHSSAQREDRLMFLAGRLSFQCDSHSSHRAGPSVLRTLGWDAVAGPTAAHRAKPTGSQASVGFFMLFLFLFFGSEPFVEAEIWCQWH